MYNVHTTCVKISVTNFFAYINYVRIENIATLKRYKIIGMLCKSFLAESLKFGKHPSINNVSTTDNEDHYENGEKNNE